MQLYLVVKTGVYDQGECGIFDTFNAAVYCALDSHADEKDNYHNFCIREMVLNKNGKSQEICEYDWDHDGHLTIRETGK